jgi:hypothetical protein
MVNICTHIMGWICVVYAVLLLIQGGSDLVVVLSGIATILFRLPHLMVK